MVSRNRGGAAPPANDGRDRPRSGADRPASTRRRKPQRDFLINLASACEFWHDANRVAFASFVVNGHHEHWAVRSREFKIWLSGQFYAKTGGAIRSQAIEDGIRIFEARAVNEGLEYRLSSAPAIMATSSTWTFVTASGAPSRSRRTPGKWSKGRQSNCCDRRRCDPCRSPKAGLRLRSSEGS